MKKKTAQTAIPEGFVIEDSVPVAPPTIPTIDPNATLKIESAPELPEDIPAKEKSGKKWFVIGTLLGLLILIGAVTLSVFLFISSVNDIVKPATSESVTPTPTITEAPKPILKNEELTFEVLNGTKTSGLAAKYGKQLEAEGYKISSLGNAEGDHIGLSIYISNDINNQKDSLITALQKLFPTATYSGPLTGSTSHVRLIIGK